MANSQGSFVKRNSDKGSLGRKPCYIYKSPEHMIGSSKRKASRDSSEERKRMIGSSKRKASRDSSEEHKRMIGSIKRKASEGSSESGMPVITISRNGACIVSIPGSRGR